MIGTLSRSNLYGRLFRRAVWLLLFCVLAGTGYATELEKLRIRAGLDLFPSFLAADLDIRNKRGVDGKLLLMLVYTNHKEAAKELARSLMKIDSVRGVPIRVEVVSITNGDRFSGITPAGIFISQPLDDELQSLMRYAKQRRILLFSPFEEDVARGAMGGIAVSERILPHINVASIHSAGIQLKSFFMQIAKRYE